MFKRLLCLILLVSPGLTQANMTVAQQVLDHPIVVGKARLKVFLFNIYDATLYAPNGRYRADQSFALSLRYLRAFDGVKIAERSVDEMRKQGYSNEKKLSAWFRSMTAIFPNVQSGTELTAVRSTMGETIFYRGVEQIGRVSDPEFTQQFFAIWLGEKTSEPEIRQQLLKLSQQTR